MNRILYELILLEAKMPKKIDLLVKIAVGVVELVGILIKEKRKAKDRG